MDQGEAENRPRLKVTERPVGCELCHRSIMQEHPFASACDGIEDAGRYVNRRHGIIVHADGRRAMHHRRFARDVRRAIPHEDEQTTRGPAVLEGQH